MEHWDAFIKRYLTVTVRLCAYTSALFFLGMLNFMLLPYLNSPVIRYLVIEFIGLMEFEVIERVVERFYHPAFASKGRRGLLRSHTGRTAVLDADDYEYRTQSEKLILSLVIFFTLSFAVSLFFEGVMDFAKEWKSSYTLFGLMGGIVSINLFLGVAIWSSVSPKRPRGSNFFILLIGFLFQLPGLFYSLFTLVYFFVWNESMPFHFHIRH